MEYAITGRVGADGSMDELDAYLQIFSASVVLKRPDGKKADVKVIDRPLGPGAAADTTTQSGATMSSLESFMQEIGTAASKIIANPEGDVSRVPSLFGESEVRPGNSSIDGFSVPGAGPSASRQRNSLLHEDFIPSNDDDEHLNPFAHSYQAPFGNSSIMSSVNSLSGEAGSTSGPPSTVDGSVLTVDADGGSSGEPDSPVSLGEYECLDLDSIPNYMAFKSSTMKTRRQRVKTGYGSNGGAEMGSSVASIISDVCGSVASIESEGGALTSNRPEDLFPSLDHCTGHATELQLPRANDRRAKRQPQQLMDLAYSYDLQRETEFNPFIVRDDSPELSDGTANVPGAAALLVETSQVENGEVRAALQRVVEDDPEQRDEDVDTRRTEDDRVRGVQMDENPGDRLSCDAQRTTDDRAGSCLGDDTGGSTGDRPSNGVIGNGNTHIEEDAAPDEFHLFG